MSQAPDALETPVLARPEALLRVPVGLASPLWGFYAGAAVTGATWWWMTRWVQPQNLEAMFGRMADAATAIVEPPAPEVLEPVLEPVVEAAEAPIEAAPIAEALIEQPVRDAPVGGEAAPIAPALATDSGPLPRSRVRKTES